MKNVVKKNLLVNENKNYMNQHVMPEYTNIQLFIHQVFQNVLKRKSRVKDEIREAIKFIRILSISKT